MAGIIHQDVSFGERQKFPSTRLIGVSVFFHHLIGLTVDANEQPLIGINSQGLNVAYGQCVGGCLGNGFLP